MQDILGLIFAIFIWLGAPAIIAHSKGRRWWVWLLISIPLPLLSLFFAMFAHGAEKNGKGSVG